MLEVDVAGLFGTEEVGTAVVLHIAAEAVAVPIFIGETEARAIAFRLSGRQFVRPLTHDLLENLMMETKLQVVKLEVDALRDSTFLARLWVRDASGQLIELDARPSDGIALAVGAGAPIYVARRVVDEAGVPASELGLDGGSVPIAVTLP